jgi:hypothetical protein
MLDEQQQRPQRVAQFVRDVRTGFADEGLAVAGG